MPDNERIPLDFSLREYISMLYKVPRMQIFLRGKKVKTRRLTSLLTDKLADTYKPHGEAVGGSIELGWCSMGITSNCGADPRPAAVHTGSSW